MRKNTKILAVAITVAILFATLSIGAFAWNEEPYENDTTLITTLNGDIFVCHSVISIYDGYAHYETTVELYCPDPLNPDEPYPDYVPSDTQYTVAFNTLPVAKIYGQDEVYGNMSDTSVYRPLNGPLTAAYGGEYELESMASYEYFTTETFIVIRDQSHEVDEVISCSVTFFWNLH